MKSETTSNELVIQGILKEAFFTETRFSTLVDGIECEFLLIDISENKIRDDSKNKKLVFQDFAKIKISDKLKLGSSYLFRSKFHRYIISGDFYFEEVNPDGNYVFKFPTELSLQNLRSSKRMKMNSDLTNPFLVFIRIGSLHFEGAFLPEDVSSTGFGGNLWVAAGFPVELGAEIRGRFDRDGVAAEIKGTVVNARILASDRPGFDLYKVGIFQANEQPSERLGHHDLRAQRRYASQLELRLQSLVFKGQTIVLLVDDISVNGFSGVMSLASVFSSVPIGAMFSIEGEGTKAKLVYFNGNRFHFYIQQRSVEDGVSWMKKMTSAVDPLARCSTKDAKELYRIFLQAGAISTQYLRRHKLHQDFLVNQNSNYNDSSYIHRWFIGTSNESADSYISSLRVGNTSWLVGDIAKVDESTVEAKKSIRSFFVNFSEFSIQSPFVGTLAIFWTKGHPFWKKWQSLLSEKYSQLICSNIKMNYLRVEEGSSGLSSEFEVTEIKKTDYSMRSEVINKLDPSVASYIENHFDITESGVGSYAYEADCSWLRRMLFRVKKGSRDYLVVIADAPPGISVNRYLDSLFLVPIQVEKISSSIMEVDAYELAELFSAKSGIMFPAIRILHSSESIVCGTEMDAFLLYPEAFSYF